jgi:hypothetical protein
MTNKKVQKKTKKNQEQKSKAIKATKTKELENDLSNICVYCNFNYGDPTDPLSDDDWVMCSVCRRWLHESCSTKTKSKVICHGCAKK